MNSNEAILINYGLGIQMTERKLEKAKKEGPQFIIDVYKRQLQNFKRDYQKTLELIGKDVMVVTIKQ